MRKMEQPRETRFYPHEQPLPVGTVKENTLQSIDSTLKRIEGILLEFPKRNNLIGNQELQCLKEAVEELLLKSLAEKLADITDSVSHTLEEPQQRL